MSTVPSAKFFVQQHAFLSKSKRAFCFTPKGIEVCDYTAPGAKGIKLEIEYSAIILPVVLDKKKPDEFTLNFKSKNKATKETFTCADRPRLLSLLYKRLYAGKESKRFYATKWTKSNSRTDYVLTITGTTLTKIDVTSQKILSQYDLMDVDKLYTAKDNETVLIITYKNSARLHFYISNEARALSTAIRDVVETLLGLPRINVVEDPSQESLQRMRDKQALLNNTTFTVVHPVDKVKEGITKQRQLSVNKDYIVDQDAQTGACLAVHKLDEVFSLIRFSKEPNAFAIEYSADHIYKYESPNRENILLDIMELYYRGDRQIKALPVNVEPAVRGIREGGISSLLDPPKEEYAESLMKQLSHCDGVALEDNMAVVQEFVSSFAVAPPLADKSHLRALMKVIPKVLVADNAHWVQMCMSALHRILFNKSVIEDVVNSKAVDIIPPCLFQSNDPGVRFFGALVFLEMISRHTKSEKTELQIQNFLVNNNTSKEYLRLLEMSLSNPKYAMMYGLLLKAFDRIISSKVNLEVSKQILVFIVLLRKKLYALTRNESIATILSATRLLVILINLDDATWDMVTKATKIDLEMLKNEILTNGTLIYQIYQSLFSPCEIQRATSLRLVDLTVSFFAPGITIMSRMLPNTLIKKVRSAIKPPPPVVGTTKKNQPAPVKKRTDGWTEVFQELDNNHANARFIWNDNTREDLKRALLFQIDSLDKANARFTDRTHIWNYEEFKVKYDSLNAEIKVLDYYLNYLVRDQQLCPIDDPVMLITELYYRLMLEKDDEVRILCVQAMNRVQAAHLFGKNVVFPHLEHLVTYMTQTTLSVPLTFELMALVSNLLKDGININAVNERMIPLLMHYIKQGVATDEQGEQLCSMCVAILLRLTQFRMAKLAEGQVLRPLPRVISVLLTNEYLPHLVNLLNNPRLVTPSAALLAELAKYGRGENAIIYMYKTNMFYYALLNEMSPEIVTLLQNTHDQQDFSREGFGLGPTESEIASASFLRVLIPEPLIERLKNAQSAQIFTDTFNVDQTSPSMIWNQSMRDHLRQTITHHLTTNTPFTAIKYPQLEKELYIGGYYISGLLDDKYRDFKVANPPELLNKIIEVFQHNNDPQQLIVLLKAQLLLMRTTRLTTQYEGLEKLLQILAQGQMIYVAARLLMLIMHDERNVQQCVDLDGHLIMLTLVSTLFDMWQAQQEEYIAASLSGMMNLLSKLCTIDTVRDAVTRSVTITRILLHCLLSQNPELTNAATTLIRAISSDVAILKKLWSYGLMYIILSNLVPPDVDGPRLDSTESNDCLNLLITILTSAKDDPFVRNDLSKVIPEGIMWSLQPNKAEKFRTILTSDCQNPIILWNAVTRQQLRTHVQEQCAMLVQKDFAAPISYQAISYPLIDAELRIASVFVRMFNEANGSFPLVPDHFARYMNGLIEYLQTNNNSEVALLSLLLALQNNPNTNPSTYSTIMSRDATIQLLLGLLHAQITVRAYIYAQSILLTCCGSSAHFLDLMPRENHFERMVNVLAYPLSLIMNLQAKTEAEQALDTGLSLINTLISKKPEFVPRVNRNGILLHLLAVFCGIVNVSENLRVKAAASLQVCLQTAAEPSTEQILYLLLPLPMIHMLKTKPADAVPYFDQLHEQPDIIWKDTMREELRQTLIPAVRDFKVHWQPTQRLVYTATRDELVVGAIYIRLYNQMANKFTITGPERFLIELIRAMGTISNQDDHLQVLKSIYHVITTVNKMAEHTIFVENAPAFFAILERDTLLVDAVIAVLHILYRLSHKNAAFVDRVAKDNLILSLFNQMECMPDYSETYLYVVLSFARTSSTVCFQLISNKKVDFLFDYIIFGTKDKNTKIKAAMIVKAIALDPEHGNSFTVGTLPNYVNDWSEYANVELPPPDAPLLPALTSTSNQGLLVSRVKPTVQSIKSPVIVAPVVAPVVAPIPVQPVTPITPVPVQPVTPVQPYIAPQPVQPTVYQQPVQPVQPIQSPVTGLPPPPPQLQRGVSVFKAPPLEALIPNPPSQAITQLPPPPVVSTGLPPPPPMTGGPPPPPPPPPPMPTNFTAPKPPPAPAMDLNNSAPKVNRPPPVSGTDDLLAAIRRGTSLRNVKASEKRDSSVLQREEDKKPSANVNPLFAAVMSSKILQNKHAEKDDEEWE